jgi:hypothetical protein
VALLAVVGLLTACAGTREIDRQAAESAIVDREIREQVRLWHRAAAVGDFDGYFSRMTAGAVFLGTDPGERWTRREFEAFARPYFDGEEAWTYEQLQTNLRIGPAAPTRVAWIDEVLHNEKYGLCRGTGVLVREPDGVWRIDHYSLSFLVPNDLAEAVVGVIRGHGDTRSGHEAGGAGEP